MKRKAGRRKKLLWHWPWKGDFAELLLVFWVLFLMAYCLLVVFVANLHIRAASAGGPRRISLRKLAGHKSHCIAYEAHRPGKVLSLEKRVSTGFRAAMIILSIRHPKYRGSLFVISFFRATQIFDMENGRNISLSSSLYAPFSCNIIFCGASGYPKEWRYRVGQWSTGKPQAGKIFWLRTLLWLFWVWLVVMSIYGVSGSPFFCCR